MLYQVNENILVQTLLPVDKRLPVISAYVDALITPMQYLNNKDIAYIYGSTFSYYATSSTYNNGDFVNGGLYYNNATYQSITSSNINNILSSTSSWQQYTDCFIGISERYNYNCQKIVLEFGLNRWFNTTFRNPNGVTGSSVLSDIYIQDNFLLTGPFIMGPFGDLRTSTMAPMVSSSFMGVTTSYLTGGTSPYYYTIWVPSAILASIPGGTTSVTNITNKWNALSINFNVMPY